MSLVISDRELSTNVGVIGRSSFALHEPALNTDVSLQINISDFDFHLTAPLIDYTPTLESGEVTLRAAVDKNVVAFLTLTGELRRGTAMFETEQFSFAVEVSEQEPRALFIVSSIMAMLGIVEEMDINIAELGMGQKVTFDVPLLITSGRLEQRLIAYRLMVIEEATGRKLRIPNFISRDDLGSIAFVYHAIVDRQFEWPNSYIFEGSVAANSEGRAQAPIDKPTSLRFSEIPLSRTLFGETISLGHATITVEDAIVQNPREVDRELAVDDGHVIKFAIRSQTGRATYAFQETPRFHPRWDPRVQALVNLESQLDAKLVARYNELASATLADLSEEEKKEITMRPEFDASAFMKDE